jgi:hypothetical protein
MFSLFKPGIQTELDRYFKAIADNQEDFKSVSKSAFSQARKKLLPEAFIELSRFQLNYFEQHAPYKKDWMGHRVIGIDGSTACLPFHQELEEHFGVVDPSASRKTIVARLSLAYDVCNRLCLDSCIAPYRSSEISLAANHLNALKTGDLVVMDRGYASLGFMGALTKKNIDFCIRITNAWQPAKELLGKGTGDIDWEPGDARIKKLDLPTELETLRIVCLKLDNGEHQTLATSLKDRDKYSVKKIKELYKLRWKIEENYKFLKHVLEIEYFTGKTILAIKQDFFARIFMSNMASMLTSQATEEELKQLAGKKKRKYSYVINRTQAMAKVKDMVINIFNSICPDQLIDQFKKLVLRCLEAVRPGRKNPRRKTLERRKHINYKGM